MNSRQSRMDHLFMVLTYGICVILFLVIVYPLFFVCIASVSDADAIHRGEVWLVPVGTTTAAYAEVFRESRIWAGYGNTIRYTLMTVGMALVCVIPAAYALSRKDFPLRGILMVYFLTAMYFNGGMVPTYMVVKNLKLLNTSWSIVLTSCVSIFHLIIARTFFQTTIPDTLREAAELDACDDIRFFFRIVLPLSKAIIAVVGLYTAVASWNSYMSALMYLTKDEMLPLQIVLRDLLLNDNFNMGNTVETLRRTERLKYALIVVSTLPIMCCYPFIQKYFAQGMMIGSVKG